MYTGDAAYPSWLIAETPMQFLWLFVPKLLYFLFSPFPWDISKSSHDLKIGMYLDIINDEHKIDEFAKLCKTIPNEIMTSIGERVYRKYE